MMMESSDGVGELRPLFMLPLNTRPKQSSLQASDDRHEIAVCCETHIFFRTKPFTPNLQGSIGRSCICPQRSLE
jgi:hypothetical protein